MSGRKRVVKPITIEKLTDVIQHPQEAWDEIIRLRRKNYELERGPDPFKDGEGKAVVPGIPFALCNVVAPASKACALGKQCKCIQAVGHTTPHRAKCGARWANRTRDRK